MNMRFPVPLSDQMLEQENLDLEREAYKNLERAVQVSQRLMHELISGKKLESFSPHEITFIGRMVVGNSNFEIQNVIETVQEGLSNKMPFIQNREK